MRRWERAREEMRKVKLTQKKREGFSFSAVVCLDIKKSEMKERKWENLSERKRDTRRKRCGFVGEET